MSSDGRVNISITGDASGLTGAAKAAASSLKELVGSFDGMGKMAVASLGGIEKAAGGLVTGLAKVGFAAQGLKTIGMSAAAMGSGLLKGNAALEMTTVSFKTLLGSAKAADDMIQDLTKFAASTPFELTGLEQNTQKLLAFGFGAKEIIPLMTSMGDSISALGGTQENLNSLVYVMGQMRSEAHLNAGDIMQMTNLGIPALQMLADHYHKTTGEMQDMISKGLVPGKEAVGIFTDSLEKKYGGMMAAQSATFSGMISNLQDWATATTVILTKPFFEPAKKALKAFLDFVQSPAGVTAINKLAASIQQGVNKIGVAFGRMRDMVKTAVSAWNGDWIDAGDSIRTLDRIVGNTTDKIRTAFDLASGAINNFKMGLSTGTFDQGGEFGKLEEMTGRIGAAFHNAYEAVAPFIPKVVELAMAFSPLVTVFSVLEGFLNGGISGAFDALRGRIENLSQVTGVDFIGAFDNAVNFLKGPATDAFNGIVSFIQSEVIPKLQEFGQFFTDEIVPKIGEFIDWVKSNVGPALVAAFNILVTEVIPRGRDFLNFLTGTLWPKIQEVWDWIAANVGPIVTSAFDTFTTTVIPALSSFADYLGSTVWPKIQEVWSWIDTNIRPIVEQAFGIFADKVIPTLGDFVGLITGTVIPVLVSWWSVIATVLSPVFTALAFIVQNVVLPAISAIWGFIDGTLIPVFRTVGEVLNSTVIPAFQSVADFLNNTLGQAITTIEEAWDGLVRRLGFAGEGIKKLMAGDLVGAAEAFKDAATGSAKMVGDAFDTAYTDMNGGGADWAANTAASSGKVQTSLSSALSAAGTMARGINAQYASTTGGGATWASNTNGSVNQFGAALNRGIGLAQAAMNGIAAVIRNGSSWGSLLVSAGVNIVQGLINGMHSMMGQVGAAAAALASAATVNVRSGLKISSPSKVMEEIGQQTGAGLAQGIVGSTKDVIDAMAGLVGSLNKKAVEGAVALSESLGKIASGIGSFSDTLTKLIDYKGLPGDVLKSFMQDMTSAIAAFMGVAGQFKAKAIEGAADLAEGFSKIFGAVGAAADAVGKLDKWKAVGEPAIKAFMADAGATLQEWLSITGKFSVAAITGGGLLADAASKIGAAIGSMADGLAKTRDWVGVALVSMEGFAYNVNIITNLFTVYAARYNTDSLHAAVSFAETTSKIGGAIGSMADGLAKVRDWVGVAVVSMEGFAYNVDIITNLFAVYSARYTEENLKSASAFADTAGKVTSIIGAAVQGLAALKDYAGANRDNMSLFGSDLVEAVSDFQTASSFFKADGLKAASDFAEAGGKVTGIIGKAVEGFAALDDYKGIAADKLTSFMADLSLTMQNFQTAAQNFKPEVTAATAAFAEGAGKITDGLGKAVSLFEGLAKYQGVPQKMLTAFLSDVRLTVQLAAQMAGEVDKSLMPQIDAFGTAIGKLFDGLSKAMGVFQGLEKYKSIPSAVITDFVNEIILTVGIAGDMANKTDKDLMDKATAFAKAVDNIFGKLKGAIDVFKGLETYKSDAAKTMQSMLEGIVEAIKKMAEMNGKAQELYDGAVSFANKMADAGAEIARGMSAIGSGGGGSTNQPSTISGFSSGSGSGKGFALGGLVNNSGVYTVGEFGPEQVWLPGGARVASNSTTSYNNNQTVQQTGNHYYTIQLVQQPGQNASQLADEVIKKIEEKKRLGKVAGYSPSRGF